MEIKIENISEEKNKKNEKIKRYLPLDLVAPIMFIFVFVAMFIFSWLEPNVQDVDSDYVSAHINKKGFVIVDARPTEFYRGKSPRWGVPGGHIPSAVSFPLEDLQVAAAAAALAKVGITKDKTLIVYCNTGVLAGRFADQLVRYFNFSASKIKNYRGSTLDWIKDPDHILLPEDHETGFEILNTGGK